VRIEAWVNREYERDGSMKVTEGLYTYVKVDDERRPILIPA